MEREKGGLRAYAKHRKALNLPGQTLQAVQDALASGRIVPARRDERGRIVELDFQLCDMMWSKNTDPIQQERAYGGMAPQGITPSEKHASPPDPSSDWAAWRARGEKAKAELSELDLKERLGELVELESVIDAISDCNIKARTALMQIPDRVAGQLAATSDPQLVYALLLFELENVVKEIAVGAVELTGLNATA